MKASIGHYEMLTYFVVHLIPNPMRQYSCSLKDCNEIDNQVCEKILVKNKNKKGQKMTEQCKCMDDGIMDWSDVSAFLYFGAKVDAGIPFNKHVDHNTGGWVGPLDLILAQSNSNNTNDDIATVHQDNNFGDAAKPQPPPKPVQLVDRYVARYVTTPTTPYLQMPENSTLFREEDFERYLGPTAVNETTHVQVNANELNPYAPYLKTSDNGNVKPILPLYEFRFIKNMNSTKEEESIQVKLNYKILTIPKKTDIMYKVFPTLQKRMNHRHGAFHISGPYCYGEDPHRGYTFDLNYDSNDANDDQVMTLVHGCVEGLPCVPSAGEISPTLNQFLHNTTKPSNTSTVEVGQVVVLTFVAYLLALALLISLVCNCRQTRRLRKWKKKATAYHHHNRPQYRQGGEGSTTIGSFLPRNYEEDNDYNDVNPFGDLAKSLLVVDKSTQQQENDLTQPLLDENQHDEEEGDAVHEGGQSKHNEEVVEEGDREDNSGALHCQEDSVPEIARV